MSLLKKKKKDPSKVLDVRKLTDSTTVVRFERNGLEFDPGQYIRVGLDGDPEIRDYSVYSGSNADFLEVLVRRVEDGLVSKQLCDVEPGETVSVGGPYGHFKLIESIQDKPLLFIATGSGISPYHSFVCAYHSFIYAYHSFVSAYQSFVCISHSFVCISQFSL